MPSKYPTRTPVGSFGAELFQTLIKAARERVELPFPSWSLGLRFQQRIHMLRAAMAREGHDQYLLVSRVRTSLLWGAKAGYAEVPNRRVKNTTIPADKLTPALLVLQPQDAEFTSIVRSAGIEVPLLAPSIEPPNTHRISVRSPPLPDNPTLDDILNSIKDE